jgi:hypothetical protein
MATKRPTLRELLEHLQHEIADVKARLAVLERPKIACVIRDPSRPAEALLRNADFLRQLGAGRAGFCARSIMSVSHG